MPRTNQVILDTDIGSDVDDALALAVALGSREIELIGITTVYGDTGLRARIASRLLRLAERSIPVFAGAAAPHSGRPVWWAGHEGALYPGLEEEIVSDRTAADALVEGVLAQPGEVDIVAIGPLTNIADAIGRDARFAGAVRHLWVMGGIFDGTGGIDGTGIEHNLRADDESARRVFASGIPTTVAGVEVTSRVVLDEPVRARVAAAGALGAALGQEITQWWAHWNTTGSTPHDPVLLLALPHPHLFQFSPLGHVRIGVGGADSGRSVFERDPAGSVRLITSLDAGAVLSTMLIKIEQAGAARHSRRP